MANDIESKLQEITDKIVKDFQPQKVVLFGSYAWGEPTAESDIDLLVVKETNLSTREIAKEIDGSLFPRPFPIDLIVHTPQQVARRMEMGDFFINSILSKGKVLYAK